MTGPMATSAVAAHTNATNSNAFKAPPAQSMERFMDLVFIYRLQKVNLFRTMATKKQTVCPRRSKR
jgi:hypothetical protein